MGRGIVRTNEIMVSWYSDIHSIAGAMKRVKKLLESYGNEHNPKSDNPSTRVHLLVELLNSLSRR